MYENIKKAIYAHEAEAVENFNAEINTKTAGELLKSWYYRERMTEKTRAALKAANPDEKPAPEIVEKIKAKNARQEAKRTAKRLEKVAAAEAAAVAGIVSVSVEWTRSRTWGWNPHARICGRNEATEDSASGCGYDKQSAAISGAMNKNPEILRILYDYAETGKKFPYSVNTFAGLPYFDGGCGMSCFGPVFEACGYDWEAVASGETYDVYRIARKIREV